MGCTLTALRGGRCAGASRSEALRADSGPRRSSGADMMRVRAAFQIHTTALALRRAYPVPRRHGAPDFDLQLCENALQLVKPEHIIVISAMSSI